NPSWVEPALRSIPRMFRDDFFVLSTTGPLLLSRTLAESASGADVTVLFPDDVRSPGAWHKFGQVGVHLMEGSWRKGDKRIQRRLRLLWEWWMVRKFMRESARLGAVRALARASASA